MLPIPETVLHERDVRAGKDVEGVAPGDRDASHLLRNCADVALVPDLGCERVCVADQHPIGEAGGKLLPFGLALRDLHKLRRRPRSTASATPHTVLVVVPAIFRNQDRLIVLCQIPGNCGRTRRFCPHNSHTAGVVSADDRVKALPMPHRIRSHGASGAFAGAPRSVHHLEAAAHLARPGGAVILPGESDVGREAELSDCDLSPNRRRFGIGVLNKDEVDFGEHLLQPAQPLRRGGIFARA